MPSVPALDELSDLHLRPLTMHPEIKYVAWAPKKKKNDSIAFSTDLLAKNLIHGSSEGCESCKRWTAQKERKHRH